MFHTSLANHCSFTFRCSFHVCSTIPFCFPITKHLGANTAIITETPDSSMAQDAKFPLCEEAELCTPQPFPVPRRLGFVGFVVVEGWRVVWVGGCWGFANKFWPWEDCLEVVDYKSWRKITKQKKTLKQMRGIFLLFLLQRCNSTKLSNSLYNSRQVNQKSSSPQQHPRAPTELGRVKYQTSGWGSGKLKQEWLEKLHHWQM